MSHEANAETIQKTQTLLGRHIKRPALTEKLLRKPPFRFLHDIVNNVIKETGFLKGLYSQQELVSENVKDKEEKIAFLNKLIDAMKAITGMEMAVRASKIIAGLESTETNYLLQAIGTALNKKLDSTHYVSQIKESKKSKERKNVQENTKKTKVDKEEKYEVKKKADIKTTEPSTHVKKDSRASLSKHSLEKAKKDEVKPQSSKAKEKRKSEKNIDGNELKVIKEDANKDSSLDILEKSKSNEKVFEGSDLINADMLEQEDRALETYSMTNLDNQENKTSGEKQDYLMKEEKEQVSIKSSRPKSAAMKSDKHKTENHAFEQTYNQAAEKPVVHAKSLVRPPSARPLSVRPSSARPGAPRLKDEFLLSEEEVVPLRNINVITDDFNKDDDDEETIIIQTIAEPEYQMPILQLPTDKGHLVEQILEQLQQSDVEHTKPTVNIEWDENSFRNRNSVTKDIEQLKSGIQTLTKAANPLGKLMSYLHEDIEAMHTELEMWVNSTRQVKVDIANQKRINEELNKPLEVQLEEIEDDIIKHRQEIVSVRGMLLRNEQRIRDLVAK